MRAKQKAKERGFTDLPRSGLLKVEDVLRFVPVSRATWYRGVASGIFPEPVRIGALTFWDARDIRALIDNRYKGKGESRSPPSVAA